MAEKTKVSIFPLLLSCACMALAGTVAWGQESAVERAGAPPAADSNIEGWHEEEDENAWTWFGMGYESRQSGGASGAEANGVATVIKRSERVKK